ncbi:MAG: hypothetical protein KDC26_10610 [Armatimonadetes bacterium]|nr:hypothetical protein [Armatimonadota bacterium]
MAIIFPIVSRVKESARRTKTISNLKQALVGLEIYRQDYDGSGFYGEPDEMGLPIGGLSVEYTGGTPMTCAGDLSGTLREAGFTVMWLPSAVDTRNPNWADASREYRESTPVYLALCHTDWSKWTENSLYVEYDVYAGYLGGWVKHYPAVPASSYGDFNSYIKN